MDQSTYSRKERDNDPKPEFLERIKKFLGVDPTPWLSDDGRAPAAPDGDALRIVHLEDGAAPGKKPKKKRKARLSKRDERSFRAFIAMGVQYFKLKLKEEEKRRKRPSDSRGG